jgi:hypothetical protein
MLCASRHKRLMAYATPWKLLDFLLLSSLAYKRDSAVHRMDGGLFSSFSSFSTFTCLLAL